MISGKKEHWGRKERCHEWHLENFIDGTAPLSIN